jgi:hypothetical protein
LITSSSIFGAISLAALTIKWTASLLLSFISSLSESENIFAAIPSVYSSSSVSPEISILNKLTKQSFILF